MAYIKIYLHCVWGTKNRIPFITTRNKQTILNHIKENARDKSIHIDFINGHKEHIHCLISLKADQMVSKCLQLIKGESSYWINKQRLTSGKFEWADEYFAVAVSDSQVNRVREYIKNQEIHHRNKSWEEEYQEFISNYGFDTAQG
ncbi:IS200/IS605 family transposase [Maribellus sediminis]|uniref:IS200/IS605 family transposase n=1 Tax=Maribellus sediminis TaxID=2696285 RepID=UPI00142F5BE7|nr:IS200/IS605 family transposase [Maribellus sediminis]